MHSPSGPLKGSSVSLSIFNSATGYNHETYLGIKPTAPILLSRLTIKYNANLLRNN